MIAVDASVAAKWFLPEAGAQAAEELLQGPHQLIAPSLLRIEVAAAITRKVRQALLTAPEAKRYCETWLSRLDHDVVVLVPYERLLPLAIDLSLQIQHPVQDCLYLAVARQHGIPLITADRPLHERAAPVFPEVRLLHGFQAH
jgi:predicted nucleic acid-binding protein